MQLKSAVQIITKAVWAHPPITLSDILITIMDAMNRTERNVAVGRKEWNLRTKKIKLEISFGNSSNLKRNLAVFENDFEPKLSFLFIDRKYFQPCNY